jgi:hypothetical protein
VRVRISVVMALSLVPASLLAQNGIADLSGVWLPEARHQASRTANDPDANCTLSGVPRIDLGPQPFKILQSPDEVVILYEAYTTFRQVFTDGRPLPADTQPSWMGYSVGKWDGDTLVVETSGFNDKTWLDPAGTRHSESLHVTERFHRRDTSHLDIKITVEDPKTLPRPLTYNEHARLMPATELHEFICLENRK